MYVQDFKNDGRLDKIATTWIKPTYAHKRYQSRATIQRKIKYITCEDKVSLRNEITNHGVIGNRADGEETAGQDETNLDADQAPFASVDSVSAINGYIQDPAKTKDKELVTGYECFPEYAAEQFVAAMDMYEKNTGRQHKDNSRLVYHIRQSFAPGEVDPRIANKVGYELALEFTKGRHAFVCATHTDKAHIHNHIVFCAFNLEANGKFKDPWFSGKRDVARISDKLCREYGLSVIDVKQGWSDPYHEWEKKQGITKADKEQTKRERLEEIIALCLEKRPKDFNRLLKYLEDDYSCAVKRRGKNISVLTPFSNNPFRLSSLSDEFTEAGIKKQIAEQQKTDYDVLRAASASDENIQNIENIEGAENKENKENSGIDLFRANHELKSEPTKPQTATRQPGT